MRNILSALPCLLLAASAWCEEPASQAGAEHRQAQADRAAGHAAEAEAHYSRAVQLWDEAGEQYLSSKCMTLINLGQLHLELRRIADAEKELTEATALAERYQSTYPSQYPEALSRLGALYGQNEQTERGRPMLKKAIQLFGQLTTEHSRELAYAQSSLGLIDVAERHLADGEAHLREAIRLSDSSPDPDHRDSFVYETNLALAYILENKNDRAEPLLVSVRAGLLKLPQVPQQLLGTVLAELSAVAVSENKLTIAEDYAQEELTAMQRENPQNPLAIALARVHLASVYIEERKVAEAEGILPDAVEEERRLPAGSRSLANAIRRLAELRALEQAWPASEAYYREAMELFKKVPGGPGDEMRAVQREYAAVQKKGRGSKVPPVSGFRPGIDTLRPN